MQKIKNIIFDLGGVFIDIDYNKTAQAFEKLGITNFNDHFSQHSASNLFQKLEMGFITVDEFYNSFRSSTQSNLTNKEIAEAWNAMLGTFSIDCLQWLVEISSKYKLFLFSNTNQIHFDGFMKIFETTTGERSFDGYFYKTYYSHTAGFRKPNKESFLKILELESIIAEETLFIDDTPLNIDGAKAAGLQTLLLQKPSDLFKLKL